MSHPNDTPCTPHEALNKIGHTFRVGINGFGSVGKAVFCSAFNWPCVEIMAVNDPFVTESQAASFLQQTPYSSVLGDVRIEATDAGTLTLSTPTRTQTITFLAEEDPSKLNWKAPALAILHVIECSDRFTTFEQASHLLHTPVSFHDEVQYQHDYGRSIWDQGGAMKVLVASLRSPADAKVKKFWPGVNELECLFQDYVVACVPPDGTSYPDVWEYARQVLHLLEVLLLRNYIVGVILVWFCEGRGPIDTPPGKSDLIV